MRCANLFLTQPEILTVAASVTVLFVLVGLGHVGRLLLRNGLDLLRGRRHVGDVCELPHRLLLLILIILLLLVVVDLLDRRVHDVDVMLVEINVTNLFR